MSNLQTSELNAHIGTRMRTIRKEHGKSLQDTANLLSVSAQQVSRFERGEHRLNVEQLFQLALGFNVPVSWFYIGYITKPEELEFVRWTIAEERANWRAASQEELKLGFEKAWKSLCNDAEREALLKLIDVFKHPEKRRRSQ